MGVIVQTILALKDRYDYVLQATKDVNTKTLQDNLDELVFKSFEALRPLRSEYKIVGDITNSEGKVYEQIGVGEFVRQKSTNETYGSNFRPDSEWSRRRFVDLMRSHGNLITSHVSTSKQEDFGRLVQIINDLKFYDELTVSLEVNPSITVHKHTCNKYTAFRVLELDEKKVEKLFLSTSDPEKVVYNKRVENNSSWVSIDNIDVTYESNIPVVEDLIDYLVKIYKMAGELVDVSRSHNEPLTTEMDTLASAYKVSKCLT